MKTSYMYIALVVVLVAGLIFVRSNTTKAPENLTALDTFGQCLTDAGAKFYGAWWCPHCQDQKKILGKSKKIPYEECSTPDKKILPMCVEKKIEGFPTWIFADGTVESSVLTLEQLSKKTACALPS